MPRAALRPLALALLLATAGAHAGTTHVPRTQVPGVYHQQIGDVRVTALFDGTVALPRQALTGIAPGVVTRLLEHGYVPEDGKGLQTAVNAYLVQRGGHLALVDTGAAQCFGPGLGQVLANLRAAGYDPAEVDDVLLTHAHPDHLCGLLDADGKPAFANATVWLSQADAGYWLDPASEAGAPQALRFAFPMARSAVAPYAAAGDLSSQAMPCPPASPRWTATATPRAMSPGGSTAATASNCWSGATSCTSTRSSSHGPMPATKPTATARLPLPVAAG